MATTTFQGSDSTSASGAPRGVPRRFGLGMLFVWTTLFSVALVAANALEMPWQVVLVLSLFVVLVGIAQWFFGQGHKARAASKVMGAAYLVTALLINELATRGSVPFLVSGTWFDFGARLVAWSIAGAVIGYIVGTLVAGVFLVSYWIDRAIARRRAREIVSDGHASFDKRDRQKLIDQPSRTG